MKTQRPATVSIAAIVLALLSLQSLACKLGDRRQGSATEALIEYSQVAREQNKAASARSSASPQPLPHE